MTLGIVTNAERHQRRVRRTRIFVFLATVPLLVGAYFGLIEWNRASRRDMQQALSLRYRIATQVCHHAGLTTPHWRPCSHWSRCFYCADENGVLTPVVESACSQIELSAGAPDYSTFLERCLPLDPEKQPEFTK